MKRWLVKTRRWWRRLQRLVHMPAPPPKTSLRSLPSKADAEVLRRRKEEVEERATVYLASIRAAMLAGANEVKRD